VHSAICDVIIFNLSGDFPLRTGLELSSSAASRRWGGAGIGAGTRSGSRSGGLLVMVVVLNGVYLHGGCPKQCLVERRIITATLQPQRGGKGAVLREAVACVEDHGGFGVGEMSSAVVM
jgi:hypothetical protein